MVMLERGSRRAELLLGGLTQPWDTRDTEQGPGCSGLQTTSTGEFSSPPRMGGPAGHGGREGSPSPGAGGKASKEHYAGAEMLWEEQHQQRTSTPG